MNLEQKILVLKESKGLINRHIFDRTVVLAVHNETAFTKHGTGMLLRVDGHPIVVTAAHVIKDVDPRTIQIISTEAPSNVRFAPDSGDLFGGSLDEELDVGFLRVGDSAAPLLAGKKFLTLDDFDFFPTGLTEDLAILFGMPGTERKEPAPNVHSFASFTYLTEFPVDVDWSAPGHRPAVIPTGYEATVEDAFSRKDVELPDPHGMSGGGLWRARFAGAPIWTADRLRLVGILTEFHEDVREVRANRVENLYHLLALHFSLPEIPRTA